jgi:hypothetical protein
MFQEKKIYWIRPLYQYDNLDISIHPMICTDVLQYDNETEKTYEFFVVTSLYDNVTGWRHILPNLHKRLPHISKLEPNYGWPIKDARLHYNQKVIIKQSQVNFCRFGLFDFNYNNVEPGGSIYFEISDRQLTTIRTIWAKTVSQGNSITIVEQFRFKHASLMNEGNTYKTKTFPHITEYDFIRTQEYDDHFNAYLHSDRIIDPRTN